MSVDLFLALDQELRNEIAILSKRLGMNLPADDDVRPHTVSPADVSMVPIISPANPSPIEANSIVFIPQQEVPCTTFTDHGPEPCQHAATAIYPPPSVLRGMFLDFSADRAPKGFALRTGLHGVTLGWAAQTQNLSIDQLITLQDGMERREHQALPAFRA